MVGTPGYTWLKSYGLTNKEISDNYFWNEINKYCIYHPGTGYQCGRNFNDNGPKYYIKGTVGGNEKINRVDTTIIPTHPSTIVITEDAISAIKVSRVCNSVAIHKAIIPKELILRLSREFKHIIIWLDPDRRSVVHLEAQKCIPYFDSIKTIVSDKDPKCYSTSEIERKLFD